MEPVIEIKLEGINEAIRKLADIEKNQLPFAIVKAMTNTAQEVKKEEIRVMKHIFDNPTPFVLNALRVVSAKKTFLQAKVEFRWWGANITPEEYLIPHVHGGERKRKRSEEYLGSYWVPGKAAPLDKYGNIKPQEIMRILSAFKRTADPYQGRTTTSMKRNKKLKQYFAATKASSLPPGIWEKLPSGKLKPIMIFIRSPRYRKRFQFYEVAKRVIKQHSRRLFDEAMAYALKTAK
jgi:hypothetical protein